MEEVSKCNGIFCTTKSKDLCDFWLKFGMPEDYCAKLLGTHWEGRFWASKNKVFWSVKCREYPEYNEICVFVDGDKTEIPSMPVMGGKAIMTFNKAAENKYYSTVQHEKFGYLEWTERFTGEGIQVDFNCKERGLVATEKWHRKSCDAGSFKYKKTTGDANDILKSIFGSTFQVGKEFKLKIEKFGNTFKEAIYTSQNEKFVSSFTLDEENELKGAKVLWTSTGVNKYKIVAKKDDIMINQDITFDDRYYISSMVCNKTGKIGEMWLERYTEMSGEYKPITYSRTKEVLAALGAPELADDLINDKTALLNIKADGEFFIISYKWKAMPLEILFKLEEEFDVVNPLTPDSPDKWIMSCNENILFGTIKGKFTSTVKFIFTENFLIQEYHILDFDICEKIMFSRIEQPESSI